LGSLFFVFSLPEENKIMPKTLIIVTGPTGIGKTVTGIQLARYYQTEIVSADSRQIFRELTIGTAVPPPSELSMAKHHFIHSHSITENYNASKYETEALNLLEQLFTKYNEIVMVGGSMLLRLQLKKLDPEYYHTVDLKNPARIIHALEICLMTGKPYSSFRTNPQKKRPFNIIKIGLNCDREILHQRINHRVDKMVEAGLEEEARSVYHLRHLNALNTVGYREWFACFDGEIPREKAIELIKRNSRRYARKQITWFAKDPETMWFEPNQEKEIIAAVNNQIQQK
jgi:tRNA dimethylallyltransferase